jgi:uncharacterized membrane protein YciS (DUF1049 family)
MEVVLAIVFLIGMVGWQIWALVYLKRDYPIEERLQRYVRR